LITSATASRFWPGEFNRGLFVAIPYTDGLDLPESFYAPSSSSFKTQPKALWTEQLKRTIINRMN
jgi:hypothetical protein